MKDLCFFPLMFYQTSVSAAACKKAQVSRVKICHLMDPGGAFFALLSLGLRLLPVNSGCPLLNFSFQLTYLAWSVLHRSAIEHCYKKNPNQRKKKENITKQKTHIKQTENPPQTSTKCTTASKPVSSESVSHSIMAWGWIASYNVQLGWKL